jgi:hypothetical protein
MYSFTNKNNLLCNQSGKAETSLESAGTALLAVAPMGSEENSLHHVHEPRFGHSIPQNSLNLLVTPISSCHACNVDCRADLFEALRS